MNREHHSSPGSPTPKIGVALSGGGHRASIFGLGALSYLADAGLSSDVVNISSVSGGSITNGFVAQQLDYAQCSKDEFEQEVAAPLAGQIARRGTLYAPWESKLYLAVTAIYGVFTLVGPWLLDISAPRKLAVFALGILVTAWLAGQRGNICGAAYRKTLFSPNGRATRLSDLDRQTVSILCATDLRTARQFYFAPRFIYGYGLGWAAPGEIRLSKAVQASASFPGGFPPARISTRSLEFKPTGTKKPQPQKRLVLADGGLYDNMADQWARGFADRASRWSLLRDPPYQDPNTLIVVNSSARRNWTPFRGSIPLWGELAAMMRDMNVLYDNTTAVRRQDLMERFDRAQEQGQGLRGCFVMISQSPFHVADYYAQPGQSTRWPQRHRNAKAVQTLLLKSSTREEWNGIAQRNSDVKTTLAALGIKVSALLMWHAYVLAMCNLHVLLDCKLFGSLPPLSRFEALARGQIEAGATQGS